MPPSHCSGALCQPSCHGISGIQSNGGTGQAGGRFLRTCGSLHPSILWVPWKAAACGLRLSWSVGRHLQRAFHCNYARSGIPSFCGLCDVASCSVVGGCTGLGPTVCSRCSEIRICRNSAEIPQCYPRNGAPESSGRTDGFGAGQWYPVSVVIVAIVSHHCVFHR